MRIGFEAKRVFHNNTGLGNYGRDVIRILSDFTPINTFLLYNTKPSLKNKLNPSKKIEIKCPERSLWKKLPSIWRLGPVINQIKNDKIDLYHGLSGEIPIGLKKNNIPTVVTIHDLIFLSHPHYYYFFDRIIYKLKFKYAVKKADKIIAISEQTKRDIIKYLKVKSEKIEVIYQGCNKAYKEKYSDESKQNISSKYKLPKKFILNVGTIQERKNALSIVKAINGTNYNLVLVGGEKKYATKIHAYIKENNLQKQVLFLKNVDVSDLAIIYQLATVFCYPSICEGFGIPIIEAMYSKTPVITSTGSCFSEAGGPNSIYVNSDDIDALQKAISLLFKEPNKCIEIAKDSYKYVQRFNDDLVANNIYELYKSVLK